MDGLQILEEAASRIIAEAYERLETKMVSSIEATVASNVANHFQERYADLEERIHKLEMRVFEIAGPGVATANTSSAGTVEPAGAFTEESEK